MAADDEAVWKKEIKVMVYFDFTLQLPPKIMGHLVPAPKRQWYGSVRAFRYPITLHIISVGPVQHVGRVFRKVIQNDFSERERQREICSVGCVPYMVPRNKTVSKVKEKLKTRSAMYVQ